MLEDCLGDIKNPPVPNKNSSVSPLLEKEKSSLSNGTLPSSFRDPAGFLFFNNGTLYRQINQTAQTDFDTLLSTGLYKRLTDAGLMIRHEQAKEFINQSKDCYQVIRPTVVPFISYPYEWSFSQLKDAALTTLELQKQAISHGMSLKDASAYNIQFLNGKPLLIDTLSFEVLEKNSPWVAYKQFCQHFLAPLALMAHVDIRLGQLLRDNVDGLPLDLASRLMPKSSWLDFGLLTHLHMHAKSQKQHAGKAVVKPTSGFSEQALLGLIDNLESTMKGLSWQPPETEWGDYYNATNYSESSFGEKHQLVSRFIDILKPTNLWDLGANTGEFSRIASQKGIDTVAFDIDPVAVEKNYRQLKASGDANLLPLMQDLTNPSPAIGWGNAERDSLSGRGTVDTIMALALIHHLAISNNVPLERLADYFALLGQSLIIEFVPKSDSQVQRLLSSRKDIFPTYTQLDFERVFSQVFDIIESQSIEGSERTLYCMVRRSIAN